MKHSLSLLAAVLLTGASVGQPLSSSEKDAVGNALSRALGVLNGKIKSGSSKYDICARLFPDGAPAEPSADVTWQSCKDLVPSQSPARASLLLKSRQPLTRAEKRQVADALANALRAVNGKGGSSKHEACAALFPLGSPRPQNSPTWLACKRQMFTALGQRAVQGLKREVHGDGDLALIGDALVGAHDLLIGTSSQRAEVLLH
eukprot:CAMPEP_0171090886 /NCGR_PEP_ID=MMETSP0766_2-20121228/32117_1 /TAXON_ID=439317 /ORGANISM="Gambierdiscus australes, Strain CAWD 149" /LENGTH=202 /DNA_ID=CAMNT_0011548927 /DNA_START=48 /DNA_END=656 /DNA_ORIENTATION=-